MQNREYYRENPVSKWPFSNGVHIPKIIVKKLGYPSIVCLNSGHKGTYVLKGWLPKLTNFYNFDTSHTRMASKRPPAEGGWGFQPCT